jgi:hypothetical protein
VTVKEAMKIFKVLCIPKLGPLKAAYRRQCKLYHPDLNPGDDKAHEQFVELRTAYDVLQYLAEAGISWEKYQAKNLGKFRRIFHGRWRDAFDQSKQMQPDDGLHFLTCIHEFNRQYIYPPPEFFHGALFGKKPKQEHMDFYRYHLHRIAPNPRHREAWAKRYWELEFVQSWAFRLPATLQLLRESTNAN